jgi:hypothetical protein
MNGMNGPGLTVAAADAAQVSALSAAGKSVRGKANKHNGLFRRHESGYSPVGRWICG